MFVRKVFYSLRLAYQYSIMMGEEVWLSVRGVARKSWRMAGRPDKMGRRLQMELGIFDCPRCRKPFRAVLSKRKI